MGFRKASTCALEAWVLSNPKLADWSLRGDHVKCRATWTDLGGASVCGEPSRVAGAELFFDFEVRKDLRRHFE